MTENQIVYFQSVPYSLQTFNQRLIDVLNLLITEALQKYSKGIEKLDRNSFGCKLQLVLHKMYCFINISSYNIACESFTFEGVTLYTTASPTAQRKSFSREKLLFFNINTCYVSNFFFLLYARKPMFSCKYCTLHISI